MVFVNFVHPSITFLLSDDLANVLNDNLVALERPHGADTMAAVLRFHDLDTDVETLEILALAKLILVALLQVGELPISTIRTKVAAPIIALEEERGIEAAIPVAAANAVAS